MPLTRRRWRARHRRRWRLELGPRLRNDALDFGSGKSCPKLLMSTGNLCSWCRSCSRGYYTRNMDINLLVLNVGNSRVGVGVFVEGELAHSVRIAHENRADWAGK